MGWIPVSDPREAASFGMGTPLSIVSPVQREDPEAISMNKAHKTFRAEKETDGNTLRAIETMATVTWVAFSVAIMSHMNFGRFFLPS